MRKRLESAYSLFKKIGEKSSSAEAKFSPQELQDLRRQLESFAGDPQTEIAKLAELTKHLTPSLSLRTLHDIMVPIERALEKNIRDDDFLVSTTDRSIAPRPPLPLRVVLDHLRSAFNVGSFMRSADGLGVEKIHLCGYTPTPDNVKTQRSSLGAEGAVSWEKNEDTLDLIKRLKTDGWHIVGLETSGKSRELTEPFVHKPTVLVFGNERFGLDNEVLNACDEIRRLDLQGQKNSLNVAVIGAVAIFEWKRQWITSN